MRRFGRAFLAFGVRVAAVLLLVGAAAYATLWAASARLPKLDSPEAIEAQLQLAEKGRAAHFESDPTIVPTPAGRALLVASGCADLLGAARETGTAFQFRLLARWLQLRGETGPGKCELKLAEALVAAMGLELPRGQRLLVAARVEKALSVDQLIAFWEASYPFSSAGPVGLDEASEQLFGKPAAALDWNEAALLAVSSDFFEQVKSCHPPERLDALRRMLLDQLAAVLSAESGSLTAYKDMTVPCRSGSLQGGRRPTVGRTGGP